MNRPLRLTGLLVLTGGLVFSLCALNPNHFTSVDSGYYLASATNLLDGRGYVITEANRLVWNGIFPIGYSAFIALLSFLTTLPVLWASKLVNLLAVGLSAFAWMYRLGTTRAIWTLSIWWLGGFLKILASTWSETIFLVILAEWVWCLFRFLPEPTGWHLTRLFLVSCALFLVRYIGGYGVLLTSLLVCIGWLNRSWVQRTIRLTIGEWGLHRLMACSLAVLTGIRAYFYVNNYLSGSPFGGERFLPTESAATLAHLFSYSLLNELLLIRDFVPNQPSTLAFVGAGLQGLLLAVLYNRWQTRPDTAGSVPPMGALSRLFLLAGLTYLIVLFVVRTVSPFSGPNLRLMAPATFCLLTASLLWVSASTQLRQIVRPIWVLLIVCSWLQLLPQSNVTHKLRRIWSPSSTRPVTTNKHWQNLSPWEPARIVEYTGDVNFSDLD